MRGARGTDLCRRADSCGAAQQSVRVETTSVREESSDHNHPSLQPSSLAALQGLFNKAHCFRRKPVGHTIPVRHPG